VATQYAVPDEGLEELLFRVTKALLVTPEPLELRLFVNDVLPIRGTTLATYTEATFPGYSRRTIEAADWSLLPIGPDHIARAALTAGPFAYTPGLTDEVVYGVYLVNLSGSFVQFQRRFDVPLVPVSGVQFRVSPVVTARSESYEV
jgi:hypothetical protein